MRVLLLNPPFKTEYGRYSRTSRSPAVTKSGTLYYPIWLCYAAAVLERAGHQIRIIDSCAYGFDLPETLKQVLEFKPEMVVIDTSTPSIYNDVSVGAEIKAILPESFIMLMGTHPTALPGETLKIGRMIDAVAIGEADYTVKDVADALSVGGLKRILSDAAFRDIVLKPILGLAYRTDGGICVNGRRELIKDLNDLPFVSQIYKKHLDTRKYFFAACDYPEVQIMTARGCTARCTFCVYPHTMHGFRYRMRSAVSIADEFQWIAEYMPEIREVGIEDDTFAGSQARVIEFCRELISRKVKLKWYCNVRVDLKLETMRWMRKAGCVLVTVGYESASGEILNNIEKHITPEMIVEFSRNTRKAGLLVHGCFMAGNRGETKETLEKTLKLALSIMDDTMQFFPVMAYPGTPDYEWFKKEGLLAIKDYTDYLTEQGFHNSSIRMHEMTADEVRQWCDYARRKYYLRPRYIIYKFFQQIRHPSEIRRTLKAANRFIRLLICK